MKTLGLTFAGGGNRAFYQLGLMNQWGSHIWPHVGAVAACSAGACVATFILSGRQAEAAEFWKQRREGVVKNFVWSNLLKGQRPTPHAPIYRDTLLHAFAEGGLERVQNQPFPIWVLTTKILPWLPALATVMLGLSAYSLEKAMRKEMIHPSFGRYLGFTPFAYDARQCRTPAELADLILASSATPPFTPLGKFSGHRLLDGGIIDNAPAFLLDQDGSIEQTVVFLTRPYPVHVLGIQGPRLYIAPTTDTPVDRWDYTRPELIEATIAMGESEAQLHEPTLRQFLKHLV